MNKLEELLQINGIDSQTEDITDIDILEILADQEYRICLIELGVTEDDL